MIKNKLSVILGQKRMKMSELAERANLNKNTVLNLYHDRSTGIKFEVLDKLCRTLDCQPGHIFEFTEEK